MLNAQLPSLLDSFGNVLNVNPDPISLENQTIKKQTMGLYGNLFSYSNNGSFRPSYYALSDTEQGLDSLSRELLVKWSREVCAQSPYIATAIRILAQASVGPLAGGYQLKYTGDNKAVGDKIIRFWNTYYVNNCCVRGSDYDFHTCLQIISYLMDQDGDALFECGIHNEFPKFNIIPSHRIRSPSADNVPFEGVKDSIVSDGVVYTKKGEALGYNIRSYDNLVNAGVYSYSDTYRSKQQGARLIFDPKYFDKGRGIPSVGVGIQQAKSVLQLELYLMDKANLETTVGYVEATPNGQAPADLAAVMSRFKSNLANGSFTGPAGAGTNAFDSVQMVNGVTQRYIRAVGGDLKLMTGNTTGENTLTFKEQEEAAVVSLIGTPHTMVFTQDEISGRISETVIWNFVQAIQGKQKIYDKLCKFLVPWVINALINLGYVPDLDEDLTEVFEMTHPDLPDLNEGYTREADRKDFLVGIKTMSHFDRRDNIKPEQRRKERKEYAKNLLQDAKDISNEVGVDINTAMSVLQKDSVKLDVAMDTDNKDDRIQPQAPEPPPNQNQK